MSYRRKGEQNAMDFNGVNPTPQKKHNTNDFANGVVLYTSLSLGILAICALIVFIPIIMTEQHKTHGVTSGTHTFEKHRMEMISTDGYGFPIEHTNFWIDVRVVRDGKRVTLQIPAIKFQIKNNGGFIVTSSNPLPDEIRPSDSIFRGIQTPSNNALNPFWVGHEALPTPTGYIVRIATGGTLTISQVGLPGGVFVKGPHNLLPTEITYYLEDRPTPPENYVLSTGKTATLDVNVDYIWAVGFSKHHVNDAHDGVVAWAWSDNSQGETRLTTNVWIRTGHIDSDGNMQLNEPVVLTKFNGSLVTSTAIAINRLNTSNIIVSYVRSNLTHNVPFHALSLDGGLTWPSLYHKEMSVIPMEGVNVGDNRGVIADKFGNFWYLSTDLVSYNGNVGNRPFISKSLNGGIDFDRVYNFPDPHREGELYTPCQMSFGYDKDGNYGLWIVSGYFVYSNDNIDEFPVVVFIPVFGALSNGQPVETMLSNYSMQVTLPSIATAPDGKMWIHSTPYPAGNYVSPTNVIFKSPGEIDTNYAGPWEAATIEFPFDQQISQPQWGYFSTPQSIIWDERRHALYLILTDLVETGLTGSTQNMKIFLLISRNNGQTWSLPHDISTSRFGNRGFPSMALDEITGNLVFGWYDGRNDPSYRSTEYYTTFFSAKQLDDMTNAIPSSNPIYEVDSVYDSRIYNYFDYNDDDGSDWRLTYTVGETQNHQDIIPRPNPLYILPRWPNTKIVNDIYYPSNPTNSSQ